MKKLVIASVAAVVALAGCASNVSTNKGATLTHSKPTQNSLATAYHCEQDTKVIVRYQPDADLAILTVNSPAWHLNNQDITMRSAVSGSGMRFVNDTNPNSLYEWHTNGKDSILAVTIAGVEHVLSCQATGKAA